MFGERKPAQRPKQKIDAKDEVFASEMYNQTIGLIFGPTILGMHGKQHHDHRSLVAKAFRATALERWEPAVIEDRAPELPLAARRGQILCAKRRRVDLTV